MSLEGVLTGAALGIMLLYLVEEAAAAGMPSRGGAVEDPGPLDLGEMEARPGRIRAAPLQEWDVDPGPLARPEPLSNAPGAPAAPGVSGGGPSVGIAPRLPPFSSADPGFGSSALPPFSGGGGGGGGGFSNDQPALSPTAPSPSVPVALPGPAGPGSPRSDPTSPDLRSGPLPQVVLVLVRTNSGAISRTVEGLAQASAELRQQGIRDSLLDLRQARIPQLEIQSERILPSMASSQLGDADLQLIAEHVGLLRSTVLDGEEVDLLILNAQDLLELGLLSAGDARADVRSRTTAMEQSRVDSGGGNDGLYLEAITQLTFTGLGDSQRARLSFDLLTEGLKNSGVLLGSGDDTLTISSGFLDVAGRQAGGLAEGRGLSFKLRAPMGMDESLRPLESLQFSLNARAVGLDNSWIDTGAGNDAVSILTHIQEDLAGDLQGILPGGLESRIQLERIGLLDSQVMTGAGDDVVRVNGSIINSTIDLGSGRNTLLLEGPVLGESRILLGDGGGSLIAQQGLGGLVQGGDGEDRFVLGSLSLAGQINGGGGSDSLDSSGSILGSRDLLIVNGTNHGSLAGVRFDSVENITLGNGTDVAVMDLEGTLTGRLVGGSGLDRLEFSSWTLPITVDLDLGSATGIFQGRSGGISGFEQVKGGIGSDVLLGSGLSAGLDGNDGDDTLYLRWTPWLSEPGNGTALRGGGGRDLFLFGNLDNPPPTGWDGRSGLPDLQDLDISGSSNLGGAGVGVGDRIGWLQLEVGSDGQTRQNLQVLTPGGVEAVGNARLLPIAPLDQLLSGMSDNTRQLAIASDGLPGGGGVLHLLGSAGQGTSQPIALISSPLGGTANPYLPA